MRKNIYILIILVLIFSSVTAFGADEVTVFVNGNRIESDVPAKLVNGSTMLPFRAILNALGVGDECIKWNENSKSIEVNYNGNYIFLVIGSSGAIFRNAQADSMITLNTAPFIENGRTYVPVRFVSEALNASVDWEESTQTVIITKL